MFWSMNLQLSVDIVVGTFNFANSSFLYHRVRHPNNYSKIIAARAARDLLSEKGAEK